MLLFISSPTTARRSLQNILTPFDGLSRDERILWLQPATEIRLWTVIGLQIDMMQDTSTAFPLREVRDRDGTTLAKVIVDVVHGVHDRRRGGSPAKACNILSGLFMVAIELNDEYFVVGTFDNKRKGAFGDVEDAVVQVT